jgi:hypothetical protein
MRHKLAAIIAAVALVHCAKPAEPETTPAAASSGVNAACEAKFQARRAYASFKEPPGENSMAIAALQTEEILSSLRNTACYSRRDLPTQPELLDALQTGALIVTAITFLTPELDVVEVVASEPTFGDATAPDARSFSIRLRRARPAQPTSYTAEGIPDEVPVETWQITGLDRR